MALVAVFLTLSKNDITFCCEEYFLSLLQELGQREVLLQCVRWAFFGAISELEGLTYVRPYLAH